MNLVAVLGNLLWAMLQVVLKSFVTSTSRRMAISTSAVFLIVFFVIHCVGNLTVLYSGDAFNRYGHKLHTLGGGKVIYAVEAYLLAAFVWHVSSGLLLTVSDKKVQLNSKFNWTAARLALSGTIISVFVVTHVITFRFGKWYTTTLDGVEVRDLWRLQLEVFSKPSTVVFYVASVLVLGAHLLWGWPKTVRKPQGLAPYLPKVALPMAEAIGKLLTISLILAYVTLPIYTYRLVLAETQSPSKPLPWWKMW